MAAKKTRPIQGEEDRRRIGEAREVLQEYGLYIDVADMSDVAYEKRVCRMKALDLVVGVAEHVPPNTQWTKLAKIFEDFIWTGGVESG